MGDPGRVRQIITNRLTNSIKFTNHGHVKFSVMKEKENEELFEIKFVIEDTELVSRRMFANDSFGHSAKVTLRLRGDLEVLVWG